MSDTQELKKCRDAFEYYYTDGDLDCPSIELVNGKDIYLLMQAQSAWTTWLACWNTRTTPELPADKQRALEALDFEIKGLRKKASFIEARNPDGSLNEITHDMKVTALKLENRVSEPLHQALTEPQEAMKASIENYLYAFHGFNDPDNEVHDILVAWTDHLTSKGIIKAQEKTK